MNIGKNILAVRVVTELRGGPYDGMTARIDIDEATRFARDGRYQFVVPDAAELHRVRERADVSLSECIYEMPIPFPRDGVCQFVGYLDT